MIAEILPPGVTSAESFGDPAGVALFPQEEECIASAVAKRRHEFTTARLCARRALARLGVAPAPVLPGHGGAPRWPDDVVGSITHCPGYRAAAAAPASGFATVGIDAEPHDPLPEDILDVVALPGEASWVHQLLGDRPDVHWDRLLFSMKEAVYKAWFPLTGRRLGFDGATVRVDPDRRTFESRLTPAARRSAGREPAGFSGRWLVANGLVVTAIAVARRS